MQGQDGFNKRARLNESSYISEEEYRKLDDFVYYRLTSPIIPQVMEAYKSDRNVLYRETQELLKAYLNADGFDLADMEGTESEKNLVILFDQDKEVSIEHFIPFEDGEYSAPEGLEGYLLRQTSPLFSDDFAEEVVKAIEKYVNMPQDDTDALFVAIQADVNPLAAVEVEVIEFGGEYYLKASNPHKKSYVFDPEFRCYIYASYRFDTCFGMALQAVLHDINASPCNGIEAVPTREIESQLNKVKQKQKAWALLDRFQL